MNVDDFDYDLPPELIAQDPVPDRARARMMVISRETGSFRHGRVADLPEFLCAGDLLVVNDTRVIPSRIFGHWEDTGGQVELLLIEEHEPGTWDALCRSSRHARPGHRVLLAEGRLHGTIGEVTPEGRARVTLRGARPVLDVLGEEGIPPVPPYIRRPRGRSAQSERDRERYQTVYARVPGAVAAPTAGLHFTEDLLDRLRSGGVGRAAVTLHVGPGTFRPVRAERVEDHVMEAERYRVEPAAASAVADTRRAGGRTVAVGTTVARTLETVAAERGRIEPCEGRSSLFIYPPYHFRAVDVLLTNFHLPRSSLLMMVAAFAGAGRPDTGEGLRLVREAYAEAIRRGYRFYSYGDCMLIL